MKKMILLITSALSFISILGISSVSSAGTVVYEDVGFIKFNEPLMKETSFDDEGGGDIKSMVSKVNSFEITKAGIYKATLADFDFPESFANLGLSITSFADGAKEYGTVWGEGSFTFSAILPGTYYASIVGSPLNKFGLGLFGVQVSEFEHSAVPIPPAVVLLGSAIAFLMAFRRGNHSGKGSA